MTLPSDVFTPTSLDDLRAVAEIADMAITQLEHHAVEPELAKQLRLLLTKITTGKPRP